MENKKAYLVGISVIGILLAAIPIARVSLKGSKIFFIFLGSDTTVIIGVMVWLLLTKRRNAIPPQALHIRSSFIINVARIPVEFTYDDIETATTKFNHLIGKGASASVFKGVLEDGTPVAVKALSGERGEREFRSEVAAIASAQHVNLVRLLGFCNSLARKFIVYEYIPNGSLDSWIFPGKGNSSIYLSWSMRYKVAVEVAKALSYLHHDCHEKVLHLDLKPENILLDENFRAVVSDFGLSMLMANGESRVWTNIRGTRGYFAPEWLLENGISEKSDVYSFGMVLLEVISGRRNIRMSYEGDDGSGRKVDYFPTTAVRLAREGRFSELVDKRLIVGGEQIEESEVKTLCCVALLCIQERDDFRPTMARVVDMLEGRANVSEPQMIAAHIMTFEDDVSGLTLHFNEDAQFDFTNPLSSSFSVSVVSAR